MNRAIAAVGAVLVLGSAVHAANPAVASTGRSGAIPAALTAVPCEVEDGSGPGQVLPCRWDAADSGNGAGLSFTVTRGVSGLCYRYDLPAADREFGGCES